MLARGEQEIGEQERRSAPARRPRTAAPTGPACNREATRWARRRGSRSPDASASPACRRPPRRWPRPAARWRPPGSCATPKGRRPARRSRARASCAPPRGASRSRTRRRRPARTRPRKRHPRPRPAPAPPPRRAERRHATEPFHDRAQRVAREDADQQGNEERARQVQRGDHGDRPREWRRPPSRPTAAPARGRPRPARRPGRLQEGSRCPWVSSRKLGQHGRMATRIWAAPARVRTLAHTPRPRAAAQITPFPGANRASLRLQDRQAVSHAVHPRLSKASDVAVHSPLDRHARNGARFCLVLSIEKE